MVMNIKGDMLKKIVKYVKDRRGMNGMKHMLKIVNKDELWITDMNDIKTGANYSTDRFLLLLDGAVTALGGDAPKRTRQLGYYIGDELSISSLVMKISSPKKILNEIDKRIKKDFSGVNCEIKELSKHVYFLKLTTNKDDIYLEFLIGYAKAVLDLSKTEINIQEVNKADKVREYALRYKNKI